MMCTIKSGIYVPNEKMKEHVERQRAKLIEAYQERVEVAVSRVNLLFTVKSDKKKKPA